MYRKHVSILNPSPKTYNHTPSYYAATARDKKGFPKLCSDLDVDIAIIGGGFTGVSTALELIERGLTVALLEANRISWGASGRCGGQITGSLSGDVAMLREFQRSLGQDTADYVWATRWRGHEIIKNRVNRYKIQCDLTHGHLQAALKPAHIKDLEALYEEGIKRGLGDDIKLLNTDEIPEYLATDLYCGGLLNWRNMHVHALDLCVGEARAAERLGAHIFELSPALEIVHSKRPEVVCQHGRVRANKVLIAGGAYHNLEGKQINGQMFTASLPIMATAALEPGIMSQINPHNLAVYDCRFVLDYYRPTADHRLLFGGGTNYSGHDATNSAALLRPALERTFPQLAGVKIEYSWSGWDGIVLNRIPQIGRVTDTIIYAQGYSGHGIALSHIMGEILADALSKDQTEMLIYESVRHQTLPLPRKLGSYAVALGMIAYKLKEAMR